eukprot:gene22858-43245_t
MVGLPEPAKVLRGMEALAQKFVERPETCSEDAATKVERASFALIEYLESVLRGKPASAVALSSQSVPTDAHVYQAKFSSVDWSGQLLDYAIGSNGRLGSTPVWDAGERSKLLVPATRVVITTKPSLTTARKGIPFRWPANPAAPAATELDAVQTTALNRNSAGT